MNFGLRSDKSHLPDAATAVGQQLLEIGELGIPVDPDLAEHMGAFEEHAVSPDDLDDFLREEEHERTF